MKLEIGMYVRTKWGYICKLININDFREPSMKYGVEASYLKDIMFIGDDDILKASHNIIDLIEVGDIIEVQEFKGKYEVKQYGLELSIVKDEYIYNLNSLHCKMNIKTIVTKQQMESMQYEVK